MALTSPKNTEGGVSTKPVDASNHRKKYLPFSHVMKLFWRCPIVFDTVPCSLRDARRNVASKYARWFVDQHTHVPKIELLAGCGVDISTAPRDHLPIFIHPPTVAHDDDMCVEDLDDDMFVEDLDKDLRKLHAKETKRQKDSSVRSETDKVIRQLTGDNSVGRVQHV